MQRTVRNYLTSKTCVKIFKEMFVVLLTYLLAEIIFIFIKHHFGGKFNLFVKHWQTSSPKCMGIKFYIN